MENLCDVAYQNFFKIVVLKEVCLRYVTHDSVPVMAWKENYVLCYHLLLDFFDASSFS